MNIIKQIVKNKNYALQIYDLLWKFQKIENKYKS